MSRLGKKPIKIPEGVTAEISGGILRLKGQKGEVQYKILPKIEIKIDEGELTISSPRRKRQERINFGLTRAKIANLIKGINRGFKKRLELFGVGYTAGIEGDEVVFSLGCSHPIKIKKPEGIEIEIAKNEITVSGTDRELVGQFSAQIHDLKRAEPYKGKGFKYNNEVIRRKVGKAALKAETGAEAK